MNTRTLSILLSSEAEFTGETRLAKHGIFQRPEAVFRITPPKPGKPFTAAFNTTTLESGIRDGFFIEELQKGLDALNHEWTHIPPVAEKWERNTSL